jgi:hypothetical protein
MLSVVWRLPVSFRFKTSYRESQSMSRPCPHLQGALHGIFRKSQLALSFAADVLRLRGVAAGKVASINSLLALHNA